jgi:hypothetical protein
VLQPPGDSEAAYPLLGLIFSPAYLLGIHVYQSLVLSLALATVLEPTRISQFSAWHICDPHLGAKPKQGFLLASSELRMLSNTFFLWQPAFHLSRRRKVARKARERALLADPGSAVSPSTPPVDTCEHGGQGNEPLNARKQAQSILSFQHKNCSEAASRWEKDYWTYRL